MRSRRLARRRILANAGRMDDLRSDLLNLWQLRRRQLDDLLEPLLAHPSAATSVAENLSDVVAAADNERAAFEAFLAAHEVLDGADDLLAGESGQAGEFDDDLAEARLRVSRTTDLIRRQGHPSQTATPTEQPAATDPPATVHQLTPRDRKKP